VWGSDADLTAEKQLILIAKRKIKDASILQEKLALLGNENLEWRGVERLQIHLGIGKIGIPRHIQNQV
jgi:hypothetical protein